MCHEVNLSPPYPESKIIVRYFRNILALICTKLNLLGQSGNKINTIILPQCQNKCLNNVGLVLTFVQTFKILISDTAYMINLYKASFLYT